MDITQRIFVYYLIQFEVCIFRFTNVHWCLLLWDILPTTTNLILHIETWTTNSSLKFSTNVSLSALPSYHNLIS